MSNLLTFPLLFCSLLFLFLSIQIYWNTHNSKCQRDSSISKSKTLPPGPWKLPIIGNLHQLMGSLLTHRTFAALAKTHGPLMHLQVGQLSTIVISSKEVAEKTFKTHDLAFSQRSRIFAKEVNLYEDSGPTFAPYGDYWRQLRKICSMHLLSPKKVNSYGLIREEEVKKLIESISSSSLGNSAINLSKMIFKLNHNIISRAAFGDYDNHQDAFLKLVKKQMELGGTLFIPAIFPHLKFLFSVTGVTRTLDSIKQKMEEIIEEIVKDHITKWKPGSDINGKEDFVDVLLHLQASGEFGFPITDIIIKSLVLDMFVGGSENPSTAIEWAMAELLINPKVMEKAQAEVRQSVNKREGTIEESLIKELSYFNAVIKETLRLHPAVPLIPRECRESCEINGYEIPSNTNVMINAWAISRDTKYWEDPESFRPERFLNYPMDYNGSNSEFIPFGAGRRICPGMQFALASIELPLAHMLYHFDWKLPNGINTNDLDMTELAGVTSGKKEELLVIPIQYNPVN